MGPSPNADDSGVVCSVQRSRWSLQTAREATGTDLDLVIPRFTGLLKNKQSHRVSDAYTCAICVLSAKHPWDSEIGQIIEVVLWKWIYSIGGWIDLAGLPTLCCFWCADGNS